MSGYDFAAIRASLAGGPGWSQSEWLARSYADPRGFLDALWTYCADQSRLPPKAHPTDGVDFYHDLVLRHAVAMPKSPALREYDPASGWEVLTYGALHERSSALLTRWRDAGVGVNAGERLALVYPSGAELLIALVTALRVGARVMILPPQGAHFVTRRLRSFRPSRIATARRYLPLLRTALAPELAGRVLPDSGPLHRLPASARPDSYTYRPDEPALVLCSPLGDTPADAVDLSSRETMLVPLRDAAVILGLGPGVHFLPGFAHAVQHQPALFLCCLIVGATYVHLPADHADQLVSSPLAFPVHVLGLSPKLRDELSASPRRELPDVRLWVTDLFSAQRGSAWADFARKSTLGAARIPGLVMHSSAAAGGALMISARLTEIPAGSIALWPVPGCAFRLEDPGRPGEATLASSGAFRPLHTIRTGDADLLLSAGEPSGYRFVGTTKPRRQLRTYPIEEIYAALAELEEYEGLDRPPIRGTTIVAGRGDGDGRFTLLVFTGPSRSLASPAAEADSEGTQQRLRERITQHLASRIGEEFLPDRIELCPVMPRLVQGAIDHAWYAAQHASGSLRRCAEQRVFQLIQQLRLALTEQVLPRGMR